MTAPSPSRVVLLLALAAVACGGRVEETVLRGYFDTCAAADDVALANAALVTLDPIRDGIVGKFRLIEVEPEVQQPRTAHPSAVTLSLHDPLRPHDQSRAVLVTKTVQLQAEMHRRNGTSSEPIAVTLARARTPETEGRWIVVRLVLNGRTLPEASSDRR